MRIPDLPVGAGPRRWHDIARRGWTTGFAAGAAICLFAATGRGQVLPGESARARLQAELRDYRALTTDYRNGIDTVDRIAPWDRRRLLAVLAAIDTPRDESRPWNAASFRAAAMMHTDAAFRHLERSDEENAFVHLDAATQLLATGAAPVHPFARRWYAAVARLLRSTNRLQTAQRFLEAGRRRMPGDTVILYESGVLEELMATDTTLPTIISLPDLSGPSRTGGMSPASAAAALSRDDVDDLRRRRASHLNNAARWLAQSSGRDRSNLQTRLHLGRVEALRGGDENALKLLADAAASADASTAYLARMFTGAIHEREQRLGPAADAYRAAIAAIPRGHAAYIALSALLQRTGRPDESRDLLRAAIDDRAASRRDPWWTYLMSVRQDDIAALDGLRRDVRAVDK